jgi:hypothetical protein
MIYWDELMKEPKDAGPDAPKGDKPEKPEKSSESRR